MGRLDAIQVWLDERLPELLAEHEVVGAQVGVQVGEEVVDAAAGSLSLATGVEATTDSVFQVGSITKLWTTTLVMQLVDEGRVSLDEPVRAYLPDFRVADEAASAAVTVRQLLSHTSGFEGDIFTTTTNGDDAVERFVADVLPAVPQNAPPGELFSYNNAGFVLLGRIVEVVREKSFNRAIREHIIEPLGLEHATCDSAEAILHRAAVGHLRSRSDRPLEPARVWALQHSNIPAGSMLAMSARDLLAFARAATRDGLLSEASAKAVLEPQVDVPDIGRFPQQWGIGWMLFDWGGTRVTGHDGGTIGQGATLRVAGDVGVTVLANGGGMGPLRNTVLQHVLGELAGIAVPEDRTPPDSREPLGDDADRYVGTYEVQLSRYDITPGADGELNVVSTPRGELAESIGAEPEEYSIVRAGGESGPDTFISTKAFDGTYSMCSFVGDDGGGRAKYLHNSRAVPRASG